jgi:hypothetical protein
MKPIGFSLLTPMMTADDRGIATLNMANGFTRDCDVLNWREDQSSRV